MFVFGKILFKMSISYPIAFHDSQGLAPYLKFGGFMRIPNFPDVFVPDMLPVTFQQKNGVSRFLLCVALSYVAFVKRIIFRNLQPWHKGFLLAGGQVSELFRFFFGAGQAVLAVVGHSGFFNELAGKKMSNCATWIVQKLDCK